MSAAIEMPSWRAPAVTKHSTKRERKSARRGKFVRLGAGLLMSEAWRSLTPSSIKYFIELKYRYNGRNNGLLHLSCDEAAKILHISKSTAMRAQRELAEHGIIRMTKPGNWYHKEATTWAITDERTTTKSATHDYKNWRPKIRSSVPI